MNLVLAPASSEPQLILKNSDFIIVFKPAKMHSAPLKDTDRGTLLNWVLKNFPDIAKLRGRKAIEPGLLHRLDYDTSGILLLARTNEIFARLISLQAQGYIRKDYRCASSILREHERIARAELPFIISSQFKAYGPKGHMVKMLTGSPQNLARTKSRSPGPLYSSAINAIMYKAEHAILELSITKGYRHQIRAHTASIGLPILADSLYNKSQDTQGTCQLQLLAYRLRFPHPRTGLEIDCKLS